jgi:hypothetical protein
MPQTSRGGKYRLLGVFEKFFFSAFTKYGSSRYFYRFFDSFSVRGEAAHFWWGLPRRRRRRNAFELF